jgi:hypothetical protein
VISEKIRIVSKRKIWIKAINGVESLSSSLLGVKIGTTYCPIAIIAVLKMTPGYCINKNPISDANLLTFIIFNVLSTLISRSLGA